MIGVSEAVQTDRIEAEIPACYEMCENITTPLRELLRSEFIENDDLDQPERELPRTDR